MGKNRRRTLKNQFRHIVCESKRLGHSKRGEKKNGVEVENYLYSYKSVKKMFALCNKFTDWMKIHHPEIKWVRQVKPEHFEEFCQNNLDNWTNATRKEYQSRIKKLGKMASRVYGIKKDFSSVEIPLKTEREKIRNQPMTEEDFRKLQETIRQKNSHARFLPDIVYRIGARSEEARSIRPEDIDLSAGVVRLNNCKNGKKRVVPIREADREFFEKLKQLMVEENWPDTCNGMSENGCNKIIRSSMRECGIAGTYKRQSLHAVRKLYAVNRMKEEDAKGYDNKISWEHVQQELGHGPRFRGDLFQIYIGEFFGS